MISSMGVPVGDESDSDGGAVHLILCKRLRRRNHPIDLSKAEDTFTAERAGDRAVPSAVCSGDVDGDGIDDILIGAI